MTNCRWNSVTFYMLYDNYMRGRRMTILIKLPTTHVLNVRFVGYDGMLYLNK